MKQINLTRLILILLGSFISFNSNNCTEELSIPYYHLFDKNLVLGNENETNQFNLWQYPNIYDEERNSIDLNIKEWKRFFNDKYDEEHLKKIIYRQRDFKGYLEELKNLQSKKQKNIEIDQNEKEFIKYLKYSLNLESYLSSLIEDPWGYDPIVKDPDLQNKMINDANNLILSVKNNFIKERLNYQLIKLYRYYGSYDKAIKIFENNFKGKNSFISYWAMDQYAGVLRYLNRIKESNYYFSKVYIKCPSKRASAYLSIDIKNEAMFNDVKEMGVSENELISMHFIRGMNGKNLGYYDLNEIIKINPKSDFARILMSREINRLETLLLYKSENYYPVYENKIVEKLEDPEIKKIYINNLISLNEKLLNEGVNNQFWNLSCSYLYFLKSNYEKSNQILNKIKTIDNQYKKQFNIIKLLLFIKSKTQLTIEDENEIGNQLYKINNGKVYYEFYESEFSFNLNEYIFKELTKIKSTKENKFLSLIYSGNNIFSDLYIRDSDQISLKDIDDILKDLKKIKKTKLVEYASSCYFPKSEFEDIKFFLLEFRAVLLMRDPNKLDESLNELKKIPNSFLSIIPNSKTAINPFTFYTKEPSFSDYGYEYENSIPDEMKFTRLKVVKAMIKSYNNAKLYNKAEDYFKLGLAYYNMSYYGMSWSLMGYYRTSSYPNIVYDMSVPRSLFIKAINLSSLNKELSAKAHFMISRCDQNIYCKSYGRIMENRTDYYGKYQPHFYNFQNDIKQGGFRNHFEILKNEYNDTKFYNEIIKECKYFEYYVNRI